MSGSLAGLDTDWPFPHTGAYSSKLTTNPDCDGHLTDLRAMNPACVFAPLRHHPSSRRTSFRAAESFAQYIRREARRSACELSRGTDGTANAQSVGVRSQGNDGPADASFR